MPSRFKVAIVTNIAWNLYNFRRGIAKAVKEAGYEPVLMAAPDEYSVKLINEGWTFVPIKNMQRTHINPAKELMLLLDFIKIYKELDIKCALHYNAKPLVYASLAASFLNIPYIPTVTGLAGPYSGNRIFISKIITILYKFSLRKSYKIIFQNKEDERFFLKKRITNSKKTSLVEGSGVDMEKFKPGLYGSPPNNKIVFLMFSRLSKAKGVEYYVRAAQALKQKYSNVEFKLAGLFDNDELAISKKDIDEWHCSGVIEYLGASNFIQKEISAAHVIVYPSYYREGIPRSLIEAAAMSKPIITTDNVGCREVVKDGVNGILIPIKDLKALINACERFILMNPDERERLGQASRHIAIERFDEKKVIEEYISLIEEILCPALATQVTKTDFH